MTTTANLELLYMEVGQADKEATLNEAFDILDSVLGGQLIHNMSSDASYTLDTATYEHQNLCIKITDTGNYITQNRNIILPTNKRVYVAWNSTDSGYSLVFKTQAGTGITVADGEKKLIYCDGTNIEMLAGLQSLEYPVDIYFFIKGKPASSELVFLYPVTRMTEFPVNLSGSKVISNVAATGTTTFSLKKNGVEFATISFAPAATSATFTAASATSLSPGDILTLVAPTQDATLEDIGFTFKVSNLAI